MSLASDFRRELKSLMHPTVGKAIAEGDFSHKDVSILAAGYRLRIPVTVQVMGNSGVDDTYAFDSIARVQLSIFPNPVTTQGTLRFAAALEDHAVQLAIVDATGRHVRDLVRGRVGPQGREIVWDRTDYAGRAVAAGTYLAVLTSDGARVAHPILVLR